MPTLSVARATADDEEADTGRVSVRELAVCTIADWHQTRAPPAPTPMSAVIHVGE